MKHTLSVAAVAALLLVAAAPAVADDEPGRGKGATRSAEARGDHGKAPVGRFDHAPANQTAEGDFVSFQYDARTIRGFSADGVVLFDATVEGAEAEERFEARADGAQIRVQTPTFRFVAHDNPLAAARLTTDGTVILTFPEGVVLTPQGEERVVFTVGNLTGAVRGEDLSVSGLTLRAEGEVVVVLDQPQAGFDVHRNDINHAIGKRHVGAEATFKKKDNASDVSQDVVSYGNVTMTTVRAEKGNLTLLVEGHGTDGRVLVLNVDNEIMGAQKAEDLHVLLDNLTVAPASNLTDVLDPENDGFLPEYYVVYDPGANAFQLLLSVPHYSVHTLSVTTPIVLPPPSVVAGVVLGVLILVPSAFVLFRRR